MTKGLWGTATGHYMMTTRITKRQCVRIVISVLQRGKARDDSIRDAPRAKMIAHEVSGAASLRGNCGRPAPRHVATNSTAFSMTRQCARCIY